jgi:hypothetical protein
MRNIFTDLFRNASLFLASLAGCLLLVATGMMTAAQAQLKQEFGPVSELTLNAEGDVACTMHANDAFASSFHSGYANADVSNARVIPSAKSNAKKGGGGATINTTIIGDPTDPITLQAAAAFSNAVSIWEASIDSEVEINVLLFLRPLGPGVLGSAGPTFIFADVPGLERESWYGNALADKLAGEDLGGPFLDGSPAGPGGIDIVANFNTAFEDWYFGIDGNTPADLIDFQTVVLHELCHGLGYFGSMFVDNETNVGDWGFETNLGTEENPEFYPAIYDRLMLDRNGKQLIKENKFPNFSTELGNALLTGPILARGPRINKATKGKGMPTFTTLDSDVFGVIPGLTDVWLPGSSYSHQDFATYAGTPEGLMVPFLIRGFAVTDPGKLVLALFDDIGWNGKVSREVPEATARFAPMPNEEYTSPLNIYPNEVRNRFVLDLGTEEGTLQNARMVDVLGRTYPLTFSQRSSQYIDFDLSSSSVKSGIYFLQLEFNNRNAEVLRLAKVQ